MCYPRLRIELDRQLMPCCDGVDKQQEQHKCKPANHAKTLGDHLHEVFLVLPVGQFIIGACRMTRQKWTAEAQLSLVVTLTLHILGCDFKGCPIRWVRRPNGMDWLLLFSLWLRLKDCCRP